MVAVNLSSSSFFHSYMIIQLVFFFFFPLFKKITRLSQLLKDNFIYHGEYTVLTDQSLRLVKSAIQHWIFTFRTAGNVADIVTTMQPK